MNSLTMKISLKHRDPHILVRKLRKADFSIIQRTLEALQSFTLRVVVLEIGK